MRKQLFCSEDYSIHYNLIQCKQIAFTTGQLSLKQNDSNSYCTVNSIMTSLAWETFLSIKHEGGGRGGMLEYSQVRTMRIQQWLLGFPYPTPLNKYS
jgi:hypothetical protein